jgi:uncharacterized membrane protein YqhA
MQTIGDFVMTRIVAGTRYLIIIPIIGLGLAAAAFFVFGGFLLIELVIQSALELLGIISVEAHTAETVPLEIEILESVHQFLIGTVLYITAVGFYQLFIKEVEVPQWLRIDSTDELETNLVGVIVVVLAINFLGYVFVGDTASLFEYGAGIALPIAALGLFVGLRTWSNTITKKSSTHDKDQS